MVLSLELTNDNRTVFHIFKSNGLPDEQRYAKFYRNYNLNPVHSVPQVLLNKVHRAEIYILSARLSGEFQTGFRSKQTKESSSQQEEFMRHNGIGFRLFDETGTELSRVSVSFWACIADNVESVWHSKHGQLFIPNRAVVAFSISHNDWEGGYWSKDILLKQLSRTEYDLAWQHIQEFSDRHPYLAGTEMWNSQNQLLSPAVTCNTLLQSIVWKVTGRDVYREKLLAVGYAVAIFDTKAIKVAKEEVQKLNVVNYWNPRWYDAHGNTVTKEGTPEMYVVKPLKYYLGSNSGVEFDLTKWVDCNMIAPFIGGKC